MHERPEHAEVDASTTAEAIDRRDAIRKAVGIGAAAGVAWAAPSVNGLSIVPGFAAAASNPEPIVASGTATKTAFCFSGAGGDDQFLVPLGDGWWHFYFQGCGGTESVALADPPGGPGANAYQAPTGYRCRMVVTNSYGSHDTGWVTDPINGIADTGGLIFIGTGQFPDNGFASSAATTWQITCEPI